MEEERKSWSDIIGNPLLEQISKIVEIATEYFNFKVQELKTRYKLTGIIFAIVSAIVITSTAILAGFGKISSDSFTFVIGTVVGYLAVYNMFVLHWEKEKNDIRSSRLYGEV